METSLLCRAAVKASSYLRSDTNLDSSLVGSKGASIYCRNNIHQDGVAESFLAEKTTIREVERTLSWRPPKGPLLS